MTSTMMRRIALPAILAVVAILLATQIDSAYGTTTELEWNPFAAVIGDLEEAEATEEPKHPIKPKPEKPKEHKPEPPVRPRRGPPERPIPSPPPVPEMPEEVDLPHDLPANYDDAFGDIINSAPETEEEEVEYETEVEYEAAVEGPADEQEEEDYFEEEEEEERSKIEPAEAPPAAEEEEEEIEYEAEPEAVEPESEEDKPESEEDKVEEEEPEEVEYEAEDIEDEFVDDDFSEDSEVEYGGDDVEYEGDAALLELNHMTALEDSIEELASNFVWPVNGEKDEIATDSVAEREMVSTRGSITPEIIETHHGPSMRQPYGESLLMTGGLVSQHIGRSSLQVRRAARRMYGTL